MADMRYGDASLRAREYLSSKVTKQLNKNITDYAIRFIKLTAMIPNWNTYLTVKQRESAEKYLKCFNAYEVDYQLRLTSGTTHQRLFGSTTSRGALGRLEEIYKMLEGNGFFAEREKKKEAAVDEKKRVKFTQQTLDKVRELIKLVVETPNYEQHLTKAQVEKVKEFIKQRNFAAAAKVCGVSTLSFQQSLIGSGGAYDMLKKAQEKRTVNSWEEI